MIVNEYDGEVANDVDDVNNVNYVNNVNNVNYVNYVNDVNDENDDSNDSIRLIQMPTERGRWSMCLTASRRSLPSISVLPTDGLPMFQNSPDAYSHGCGKQQGEEYLGVEGIGMEPEIELGHSEEAEHEHETAEHELTDCFQQGEVDEEYDYFIVGLYEFHGCKSMQNYLITRFSLTKSFVIYQ